MGVDEYVDLALNSGDLDRLESESGPIVSGKVMLYLPVVGGEFTVTFADT